MGGCTVLNSLSNTPHRIFREYAAQGDTNILGLGLKLRILPYYMGVPWLISKENCPTTW